MTLDEFQLRLSGTVEVFTLEAKGKKAPDQKIADAILFRSYWDGFLSGMGCGTAMTIGATTLQPSEIEKKLADVPEWMFDPQKAARSLHGFLQRHRPKGSPGGLRASTVLLAWYQLEHPGTTPLQRLGAISILSRECAWGDEFPARMELIGKVKGPAASASDREKPSTAKPSAK